MMKYWLFQNNQVAGPFDRDELSNTPGFSAESLVCPEGRKGTQMGDWQRAGVMAELAETLLKMARVPAGAAAGGGSSFLPPEPTLRDLAVLGTLQEKVSLLENSLSSLHEELRAREEEIAALKTDLSQKAAEAADMQSKVGDLEVKLDAAESLRSEVNLTKEAQAGEAKLVEDLKTQLDAVRAELQSTVGRMEETQEKLRSDLSSRIDSVRSSAAPARPAPAPAAPPPGRAPSPVLPPIAPAPGDVSLSIPEAVPFGAPAPEAPAGFEPPALGAPGLEPAGFETPGLEPPGLDFGGPTPAPVPLDAPPFDLNAPPLVDQPAAPLPVTMAGGGFDVPPPSNPFGSHPTPLPMAPGAPPLFGPDTGSQPAPAPEGPVDLMATQAKPKRKAPLVALAVLLVGGGGLGAAWQMGLLDAHLKQFGLAKGGAKAPAPAPAPAPEPAAPPPVDPQQGVADRTADALELAKGYPIPRLGKSLAQVLEAAAPGDGLVSPWNVKPGGEGRFEVSFYGKPGRLDYSYEVRPDAKEVRGLNAKSQAVLDGKAPPPAQAAAAEPPAGRRKGRYTEAGQEPPRAAKRPRADANAAAKALSEDPLGALLLESSVSEPAETPSPRPKARRARRAPKPAEEAAPAPELSLEPPAEEEPAEEAPAPKRRRGAKPAAKSDEELTLDELLLPGVPKR